MNSFFNMLKKQFKSNHITSEEFKQALIDEEILDGDKIIKCYKCLDSEDFYTIKGGDKFYLYFKNKMKQSEQNKDEFEKHYLTLLDKWLSYHNIKYGYESIEYNGMETIICNQCGSILGIIICGEFYTPYCGYFDDLDYHTISSNYDEAISLLKNNIYKQDLLNKNYNDLIKKNYIKDEKIILSEKLDNYNKELKNILDSNNINKLYKNTKLLNDILETLKDVEKIYKNN